MILQILKTKKEPFKKNSFLKTDLNYLAKLIALVSRITVIFICPGYVISS